MFAPLLRGVVLAGLLACLPVLVPVFVPVLGGVAQAQTLAETVGSTILTLNQDRLFNQSAFGKRVLAEIETRSAQLKAENHRIESDLKAQELALTEQRKTLPAAEFRPLANAFDKKFETIRAAQARKSADLSNWTESEQQRFVDAAYPELLKLTTELGALIILDQRSTIITSARIDVTDQAIVRIDQVIGDGAAPKVEPPQE